MATTAALNDVLQGLAAESSRLAALEAELTRREAELATAMEAWTAARQESTIWVEATAARDRHWRALIDHELEHWSRNGNVYRVLVALQNTQPTEES